LSYGSLEGSTHAGSPVELYRFALGTSVWRYTSAQSVITRGGESYIPAPIRRSEIEQTQEFGRAMLTIDAALTLDVAEAFIATPPDGVLSLTIFRGHLGDLDNEIITWWKGRVVTVIFGNATATLRCEPIFTTLKRGDIVRRARKAKRMVRRWTICCRRCATFDHFKFRKRDHTLRTDPVARLWCRL